MREEFIKLYSEVYKDMYRFALYTLNNEQEAEDAVSEAILDAYASFEKLRKKESFKSWIFAILSAKCKRHMRAYYDENISLDSEEAPEIPENKGEQAAENMDLKNALHRLEDRERIILNLKYIAGYEGKEIAAILKMNYSTVRTVERRALMKLKAMLEG